MRPDASENSQINPSTIVRAAGAAGSQPHLASGFQGRCKIATLHAGFGVIRGMSAENLTTLPHLSISSATSFPKSAGEPGMTVPPSSARRALTAASAKPAFISVLSLSIMWLGVFLGAATPYHALAS